MARYSLTGSKTLATAATQTLLQVATSSSQRIVVYEWSVSMNGSAAAASVQFDLLRQTTAGTGSATPPTPRTLEPSDTGASSTTITWNHSAEPTAGDILGSWYVSPFGGLFVMQYPLGREIVVGLSGRIGIRAITASGVTPGCVTTITWDE